MTNRALTVASGAPGAAIVGIGDYRPRRVVPNSEIVDAIDSSDEWIRERSGIASRHQADDTETVVSMAAEAGRAALEHAGVAATEVDQILVSSITYPTLTPAAAPLVGTALGCENYAAYDLGAACAAYTYGIAVADASIRAGLSRYTLVIGSEKFSDFRDPTDRGTAFIFGDGAGAALVGPSDTPGIGRTVWGADGTGNAMIEQQPDWLEYRRLLEAREPGDELPTWPFIAMQGPSVFRWASFELLHVAREAIEAAGVTVDDIEVFVPHQANVRIIDAMVKKLKLPEHVVVARDDLTDVANTSAASIPLATARLYREGRVRSGALALQMGFGAGLAWGAQVVRLP